MIAGEVFGVRFTPLNTFILIAIVLALLMRIMYEIGYNNALWDEHRRRNAQRMREVSGPHHPDRNPTSGPLSQPDPGEVREGGPDG